jgi:hypothetical protein
MNFFVVEKQQLLNITSDQNEKFSVILMPILLILTILSFAVCKVVCGRYLLAQGQM